MGRSMRGAEGQESPLVAPARPHDPVLRTRAKHRPEKTLAARDPVLAAIMADQKEHWSDVGPDANPVWGLIRVVVAQQISTKAAITLATRVAEMYPGVVAGDFGDGVSTSTLRSLGLSPRKAACCALIVSQADEIRSALPNPIVLDELLGRFEGIGPWTKTIFRMLVLRETDLLPKGDLGLERAIRNHYGAGADVEGLASRWRPYRSVACWYLWRSLGNAPLG